MGVFGLGLRGNVRFSPARKIALGKIARSSHNLSLAGTPCPLAIFTSHSGRNPNTHSLAHFFLFFFWFLVTGFWLLSFSYAETSNFSKAPKIEIEKARKTLRVGEKFVYSVYWMGVPAGEGILEIKELVNLNGREAYHIIGTAKSNDFLSAFYKVEDIVHSYIDKKDLCSLKFEKHQREGKYKADEITVFDQERHKGYYESLLSKKKKEFDIPAKVQDITSAFYYFRTLDVKPNSNIVLDVNADEKNHKANMNILQTEQLEILRKGVHKVFCVEPKAPFKGVISKRSKVWVYFTVDENRVPVLIKIRIPFGFVVGVLEKTE